MPVLIIPTMTVLVVENRRTHKESRKILGWAEPRKNQWLSEPLIGIRLPHPVLGPYEQVFWILGDACPRIYRPPLILSC